MKPAYIAGAAISFAMFGCALVDNQPAPAAIFGLMAVLCWVCAIEDDIRRR